MNAIASIAPSAPLLPGALARDAMHELASGEVQVWIARLEETDARALDRCRAMLNDAELQRLNRLASEPLKAEFLLTRGLCRLTLSAYANVCPKDWEFECNAYGKPSIALPANLKMLRFNLTNTRTLAACAVAFDVDIGVDIEPLNRTDDTLPISTGIFTSAEVLLLRTLGAANRVRRFYELWTLKEAYAKAKGTGLSELLDRVSFQPQGSSTRACFDSGSGDCEDDWQFEQIDLDCNHLLALAVHKKRGPRLRCTFRKTRIDS